MKSQILFWAILVVQAAMSDFNKERLTADKPQTYGLQPQFVHQIA